MIIQQQIDLEPFVGWWSIEPPIPMAETPNQRGVDTLTEFVVTTGSRDDFRRRPTSKHS